MTEHSTMSPQAREILALAEPFDLGRPANPEEWQMLRAEIEEALDFTQLLKSEYSFSTQQQRIAAVPVLTYHHGNVLKNSDKVSVFLHGSAYVVGSPRTAAGIVVPMTCAMQVPCIVIDYGLAPERPFPQGLNDALAVYRTLLGTYPADAITVYGSSAGGAMAVSLLLEAQREGLAMPAALGLISPWSELSEVGDSYRILKGHDPVIDYRLTLEYAAQLYAGDHDPTDPRISPVYADFPDGFPPTLIQTGTRDLFLSNCVRLHRKMKQDDVQASLSAFEGMWHAFQITPGLPEGREALLELAGFLARPAAYFLPER